MNQHDFCRNTFRRILFKGVLGVATASFGGVLGGLVDLLFCSKEHVPFVLTMVPAFLPCIVVCVVSRVAFGDFAKVSSRWLFLLILSLMLWGVLVSELLALYYHWHYELERLGIDVGRYPLWRAFRDVAKGDPYFVYRCLVPFFGGFSWWAVFVIKELLRKGEDVQA